MDIDQSRRSAIESGKPPCIEDKRFRRNLWILSLFSLPVIYLGIILAVFVHEVIGHGLMTSLLGGQFSGFGISPDGMGWANVEFAALPALRQVLIYFSGAFFTTLLSLFFFSLSYVFQKHFFTGITCLFFAIISLLDGLPYFFWDAIRLAGIGDFSRLWTLSPNPALRIVIIVFCGLLMTIGIIFFNIRYYQMAYSWLGEGKPIKRKGIFLYSLIIFLLQVMAWFSFDWDQLVPGVGSLPGILALVLVLATLIPLIFVYTPEAMDSRPATAFFITPLFAAWILCAGVIFSILQWLQKGITFL